MIKGVLALSLLVSLCGSPSEVTVELTPSVAAGASSGPNMTVELYPVTTWIDVAGLRQLKWTDEPALTAVAGLDSRVVFAWDPDKPFRIATTSRSAGSSCWVSGSEVFVAGGESVQVPLAMICE